MKIIVTGCAGFIGSHTCEKLLKIGDKVIGIDNLNDYYDVSLKKDRLRDIEALNTSAQYKFYNVDISDLHSLKEIFKNHKIESHKYNHCFKARGSCMTNINPTRRTTR